MFASKGSDAVNASSRAVTQERGLVYRFADCLLDSRSLELKFHGQLMGLEPKGWSIDETPERAPPSRLEWH